jgi:hypothetical protein
MDYKPKDSGFYEDLVSLLREVSLVLANLKTQSFVVNSGDFPHNSPQTLGFVLRIDLKALDIHQLEKANC